MSFFPALPTFDIVSQPSKNRRQAIWAALIALALIAAGVLLVQRVFLATLMRPRRPHASAPTPQPLPHPGAEEPSLDRFEEIDRVTRRIKADAGGQLVSTGGAVRLDVPARALPSDTEVALVRFAASDGVGGVLFAYDLRPNGLELDRPARLAMALPQGFDASETEIVTYDLPTGRWRPEPVQTPAADGRFRLAHLSHFSLRRIRIRPEMSFPFASKRGRATFYLESDAGNSYERLVEGRWAAVRHGTSSYRNLMRLGRLGRHSLIATGRLRSVTGARPVPTVFRDQRRSAAMPRGVPQARTGWVLIRRLDAAGEATGHQVVARVNDYGPGPRPRRAGVVIDLSRATMEALGLRWGQDFGTAADAPEIAWISLQDDCREGALHYLPVEVEAYDPQPPRVPSCRLW